MIIRGGVAKARHISTSYKTPIKPPFDLFVSRLNAQVSCYASWRLDPGTCNSYRCFFNYMGNNFSMLYMIVRVEAESITTVSFWPTQPCIAVTPDSRCAKDTSTATDHEDAQNAKERA